MANLMSPRDRDEYRALRTTIRARATARTWVFLAGLTAWAALAIGTAELVPIPLATLLPLLVLAGTFEAVFALHVGVERIGRYLQVFHSDAWERTAMAFGAPLAGTGADPLFALFFALATIFNFAPLLLANPTVSELVVIGGVHALVLARIVAARRAVARQRASDLARFQQLYDDQHRDR
jgi:hypothetical protein